MQNGALIVNFVTFHRRDILIKYIINSWQRMLDIQFVGLFLIKFGHVSFSFSNEI